MNNKLVYLAIPYTWNPLRSFEIANKVAAVLMQQGYTVFSPISHSHPINQYLPEEVRTQLGFWLDQDCTILAHCEIIFLVTVEQCGQKLIENSPGCQRELSEARDLNIPLQHILYEDDRVSFLS